MGDRNGDMYALTVLAPLVDGQEDNVRQYLRNMPTGSRSPLARLGTTHFARWLVLSELVYQGRPQRPDPLTAPCLLFISAFDGDLDRYLDSMRELMSVEVDEIWGHCVGYPGSGDREPFLAYLRRHQVTSGLFFSAYPQATVAGVLAALDVQDSFTDFAIAAQTLSPSAIQERFAAAFPDGVTL